MEASSTGKASPSAALMRKGMKNRKLTMLDTSPFRAMIVKLYYLSGQTVGNHQHLLARPARRFLRALPDRCIEHGSNRAAPGAEVHHKGQRWATGAPCRVGHGQVGEEDHRRARKRSNPLSRRPE